MLPLVEKSCENKFCKAPVLFKKWEKIALAVTSLFFVAILILSTAPTPLPFAINPLIGIAIAAGGLALEIILISIKYYQKRIEKDSTTTHPSSISKNSNHKIDQASIESLKQEYYLYIDSLNLPDTEAEIEQAVLSNKSHLRTYSKEILKEDVATVIKNLPPEDAYIRLKKMYEALPYHLATDHELISDSPYKPVGIPNYHGNNCYVNTALQILVHSRACDYALLRPFRSQDRSHAALVEIQGTLLYLVENLRLGRTVTKKQMEMFFEKLQYYHGYALLTNGQSEKGSVRDLLILINAFCPELYSLKIETYTLKMVERIKEERPSVIILSTKDHFKTVVFTVNGAFEIDDRSVKPSNFNRDKLEKPDKHYFELVTRKPLFF